LLRARAPGKPVAMPNMTVPAPIDKMNVVAPAPACKSSALRIATPAAPPPAKP
jgi:hypothetical protein